MPAPPSEISGPVDTVYCDYGGVVADHYSEPYLGQLAALIGVDRATTRSLLSERTTHGKQYRLATISLHEFWDAVARQAHVAPFDHDVAQDLWARTYIPNAAVQRLLQHLRTDVHVETGIVLNEDLPRLAFLETTYRLSTTVTHLVASCTMGVLKPDPLIYRAVLKLADREHTPQRVLYVDDRQTHVAAAEAAGMVGYCYVNAGEFSLFIGELIERRLVKGRQ